MADMATAVDGTRLTALQALWRLSAGLEAGREVAIAKTWANRAHKNVTVTAHHLHGGMSYVREYDLHLWSQRAKATELCPWGPQIPICAAWLPSWGSEAAQAM